ncbi:MAG: twin-arginine translocase TatA/TatE family subunit [Rhodomicrobiaceae bacterium]
MGITSFWHWIIVILVIVLLFGQGKISDLMGDVAKGIKSFKKGMAEEDEEPQTPAKTLELEAQKRAERDPVKEEERKVS